MHVLHVTPYYEGAWAYGGIPRVVAALAGEQVKRGHRVTVCTSDAGDARSRWRSPPLAGPPAAPEVRVFANLSNRAAFHLQLFLPRGLGRFLERHSGSFEVAHLHACHNLPVVTAARCLRRAGVPYLLSPHGTAPWIERRLLAKRLFDLLFARKLLPGAHRVVAVSQAERRQLESLGLPETRLRVVANPVSLPPLTELPPAGSFRGSRGLGKAPLVLSLGRLSPRKRLDLVAHAFATLDPRCRLVLAGPDMGVEARLRRLLERLGVQDRCLFTGLLVGSDRLAALVDADILLHPAEHEVFGLAAVEALACGTPVVVADDSGCGEVVAEVGGGRVVAAGEPGALASAAADLLADFSARERARAAGAKARRLFAPETTTAALEAVYREVLGEAA